MHYFSRIINPVLPCLQCLIVYLFDCLNAVRGGRHQSEEQYWPSLDRHLLYHTYEQLGRRPVGHGHRSCE
jgi:hypothetical protein